MRQPDSLRLGSMWGPYQDPQVSPFVRPRGAATIGGGKGAGGGGAVSGDEGTPRAGKRLADRILALASLI